MAIEATLVNCFPFCDLRTSAVSSGESRPFCPPTLHQASLPNDTSDTLCLLLFISSVYSVFTAYHLHVSMLMSLHWQVEMEIQSSEYLAP